MGETWRNRIIDTRMVPAEQLHAHPDNWRTHPDSQASALRGLLAEVGIVAPLIAYESERYGGLTLIDGHLRRDAGGTWPVTVLDVSDEEADLILATFDPLADLAERNDAILADLLGRVEMMPVEDAGVQALLEQLAEESGKGANPQSTADAEPQVDRAEELRQRWGVESGQLWQLGDHRLICGDCTDADVVARVMGGEKADICFTSPPYADQRQYHIGNFDWLNLANGFSSCVFNVLGNPADFIVNLGMSYKDGRCNLYWDDWLKYCESLGHPLYGWYVWDKGTGFPGEWNGRLAPAHEFLFHFSIGRVSARKWIDKAESSFERNRYAHKSAQRKVDGTWKAPSSEHLKHQPTKIPDSVVRINRETEGYGDHPAVFPVELPEFMLRTWSDDDAIVYEPFSGSGTTIIACENLGRKCRAIEISPAYVAVALQRWADATGREPVLTEAG